MKPKVKVSLLVAAVALALVAAPAVVEAGKANISITMNNMSASGTQVTASITNNSTVDITVDFQVVAYLCGGVILPQVNCTRAASAGVENGLGSGATADFTVMLPIGAGDYIFVGKAVGRKGGSEDRKEGFIGHTVP